MNTFTLIINSGRSGSTFLEHLLSRNYSKIRYVAHEDIPVQISKPRLHNRAFTDEQVCSVLGDSELKKYLEKWEKILENKSIIETGWSSYHLAPVLFKKFGDAFRIAILHRDPISFAFSRANMGNYHKKTLYDDAHEVSPHDPRSIAPEYSMIWGEMNHFEKCMFWWYTVYKEGFEFRDKNPKVPCFVFSSSELFNFTRTSEILKFLELEINELRDKDVPKNELPQLLRETFPVGDEWKSFNKHDSILDFARTLGYSFDADDIAKQSRKYKLPNGIGPLIRHKTNFWRIKINIARPVKKILKKLK